MTVLERLAKSIERHWYGSATGNLYLLPLWLIFVVLSSLRRTYYRVFPAKPSNTPVIVIGNIAIGGTGKTPLIAYLALRAKVLGLNPGIVSRGYGGTCDRYPLLVDQNTDVCHSGDEPALLFHTLQCPVVVDPNRAAAVAMLSDLSHQDTDNYVDIILSDDGLQHYAMARQAEIIVSDKTRGMGNGWCLPIGPLREPVARLKQADLHLVNGSDFII
ncbi:MAG: tetraacyldisaccharide 4'-kinase, partial [Oleibacter sp.]|nr:tetraacyldisaccharide 4'-kinase [Thalassolituus sp.]